MSRRAVVIVQPYSSGNMFAPVLRRAGFAPCAVTVGADAPLATSFHAEDFDHHFVYEASETEPITAQFLDPVVARLSELDPLAIIPGEDGGVMIADRLAAILTPGLANVPRLESARRHKGDMYNAVAAAGLPVIRGICARDPAEIQSWLHRETLGGRDLVVKPADASGTDGVTLLKGGRGWQEAVAGLAGAVSRHGIQFGDVIVQEYATGTEYAVDTFSYEGIHTITDIAKYNKVTTGKHMAIYESMEFLPFDGSGHDEIVGYTKEVLDALGMRFGITHTEIMLTKWGPRLIEMNARLPGGAQPWACQLATGDNLVDRLVRYLSGERDIRHDYTLEMTVLIVFFAVRSAGTVSGIAKLDAIKDLESCCHLKVNVSDGDYVPETADLLDAHQLGVAVLGHEDPGQVRADHLAVRQIASTAGRPGGFTIGALAGASR
jgi:biotin carboxylase